MAVSFSLVATMLVMVSSASPRLLLQTNPTDCDSCVWSDSPVCCDGNIEYSNQCYADCSGGTNCISQECNAECQLIDIDCGIGNECQAVKGGNVGEVGCSLISDYCAVDNDCEVKDVGNCCGYYPKCMNNDYEKDAAALAASCVGMSSVCGWPVINACSCVNSVCVANTNTLTQVPDTTADAIPPKCCPVLDEDTKQNLCWEGCACCPDGTWAGSIGDGVTYGCGGKSMTSGFGEACDETTTEPTTTQAVTTIETNNDCDSCAWSDSPVCCDGNIQYANQCYADCSGATNCISQECDAECDILDIDCVIGNECQAVKGGNVGEVGCSLISDYCAADSDCAVKDVGNCCGYYPKCMNNDYEKDAAALAASCVGMSSVCGWPVINACSCVDSACVANTNTLTQVPDTTEDATTPKDPRNGGCGFHIEFGAMLSLMICIQIAV